MTASPASNPTAVPAIHAAQAEDLLHSSKQMGPSHDSSQALLMAGQAQAHAALAVFYALCANSDAGDR